MSDAIGGRPEMTHSRRPARLPDVKKEALWGQSFALGAKRTAASQDLISRHFGKVQAAIGPSPHCLECSALFGSLQCSIVWGIARHCVTTSRWSVGDFALGCALLNLIFPRDIENPNSRGSARLLPERWLGA